MGSSKNKSFVGGFPNANLFPFAAMVVKTTDGRTINIEGAKMKRALQYLPTAGLPELVTWMKNLQVQQENKMFFVFFIRNSEILKSLELAYPIVVLQTKNIIEILISI